MLSRGGGLQEVGEEQTLPGSCHGEAAAVDPADGTCGPAGRPFMVAP